MASQEETFGGYKLSGWWRRVGAYLLDGLFLMVAYVVVFGLFALLLLPSDLVGLFVFIVLVGGIALNVVYWGWTMAREGENNGQSFGKQALGIRVLPENEEAVTFWYAVKRQIVVIQLLFGALLSALTGGIMPIINYLWPLWDEKRQCLHDKIVSSRVVVSGPAAPSQTSVEEIS